MPRYACFSWLAAWRHRRGLHDRRLLLFACMVHPVRLLGICRVDRLDESFLWPALCRLGCHRRSGPHHFRCCFLVCAFVMPCFVDPAISVIAAVSCRCQCPCSCVTRIIGSSDAPVAPAVLNVLFLASLLFVHFACSSWPSCALRGLSLRRILTGNSAEKNAYF